MLEAALIRGLTEGGIDVMQIGMGPTPMLYFATHYLDVEGGIQVTGSHNPADYNGFKMLLKGRSVFGQEIQALGRRAASGDWSEGDGSIEEVDIREAYVNRLLEGFSGKAYRIGWDAGNGAAGPVLDMLVEQLPGHHHVIFSQVDGTFPNHHPDPTVERISPTSRRWSRASSSTSALPLTATATASAQSTARAGLSGATSC